MDIDDDILSLVERRLRVQADLNWLREEIRTYRKYAEITMNESIRLDYTKAADAYQLAANRAEERLAELWTKNDV